LLSVSVEKGNSSPGKKRKAEEEPAKETPGKSEKKVPVKEKPVEKPKAAKIPQKGTATRQSTSSQQKSPPKKVAEKKKPAAVSSPAVVQRKTTRGSLTVETIRFSDSEDETLDKKMKKAEEKKKLKKVEKEKTPVKQSLATIKKAKTNAEKIKAQSMSQLVRFTKKKFLNVRKSTEACIQELVASTLERLNKQEEEEADEIDLDLIDEPVIVKKKDSVAEKKKETAVEKKKEQSKEVVEAELKKLEGKKIVPKHTKELVAKKSATYVPAPAKKMTNEKFYAKKTAAIYPPSPAKLKKLAKVTVVKEMKKPLEQKIAPKPSPEKAKVGTVEDNRPAAANLTPVKTVQLTQTSEIATQNFVMFNSTNQDLVLIPSTSASSTTSPGKYIVCRKEAIVTTTAGVQYMMVPTDKVVLPVAPVASVQPQIMQQPEAKKPAVKKQEPEEPKKLKASSSTQICKYS